MTEREALRMGFHRLPDGSWHKETSMYPQAYNCPVCWERDWGVIASLEDGLPLRDAIVTQGAFHPAF